MMGYSIYTNTAQIFMMGCSLFATVTGYLKRKKQEHNLKVLYIYPLASFTQMTILYININCPFDSKTKNIITYSSDNLFLLIEFYIIYHFFLATLKLNSAKKILYGVRIIYPFILVFTWYKFNTLFAPPFEAYILQAFFILIPVLMYFFELFKWPTNKRLTELPSFWIVTGIAIYFASTLPLFLLKDFILSKTGHMQEESLYLINFIAYSIMFLFIGKAFLCHKIDIN